MHRVNPFPFSSPPVSVANPASRATSTYRHRRAPVGRRDRRARSGSFVVGTVAALAVAFAPVVASASEARSEAAKELRSEARSRADAQSLDQQVQDIKSDVLAIASELRALEERLLHPSSTQVAVFVEIGEEQGVLVDAARLLIDGEVVAHHVYTHGELEALRKGGVQRLYTGNLREGEHALRVEIEGRRATAGRFESSDEFVVRKAVGPKKVGITIGDALTSGAQVAIRDW